MIRRPVLPRPSHRRGTHGRPARGKAPTALHTMIPRRVRRVGSSSCVLDARENERGEVGRAAKVRPTPPRRSVAAVRQFLGSAPPWQSPFLPPSSPMRSLRLSGSPPSATRSGAAPAKRVSELNRENGEDLSDLECERCGWEGLRRFLRPSVSRSRFSTHRASIFIPLPSP